MKISYLIITYNRATDLQDTLKCILQQNWTDFEIIIVDNASVDETPTVVGQIINSTSANIVYHKSDYNLGVSLGRNMAISLATGDIMITIDDDAVFASPDATRLVAEFFQRNPDVGILAFKITDYSTRQIIRNQFPTRNKKRDPDVGFETTWFIGAGHAVRREVYEMVGAYRDYTPYGSEELDLSYKALDKGFRILYFPQVEILHKMSLTGRITDKTTFNAILLKNRIKVAFLNLPAPYFITHTIIWSLAYLSFFSKFNLKIFPLVCKWIYAESAYWVKERRPITSATVKYLKDWSGQIWY
jgi:GT2 family glycosyltransferase